MFNRWDDINDIIGRNVRIKASYELQYTYATYFKQYSESHNIYDIKHKIEDQLWQELRK